jgi:hypothetical protein
VRDFSAVGAIYVTGGAGAPALVRNWFGAGNDLVGRGSERL